jgi:CubicO group peptidase (beta-lactamase class C family)
MLDSVRAAAAERVARGPASGIVVTLIDDSGVRHYSFGQLSKAFGASAVDSTTVFEVASVTKVFVATLLAEMVLRGEVGYDDPVQRYLPDSVRAPTRNGTPITLRHLVSHRSGLARGVRDQVVTDTVTPWAETMRRLYDHLPVDTLRFEPGTAFYYSNLGAGLLGHALERRGRAPLEALLYERLFVRLGMEDTRASLTSQQRARLAAGYNRQGEPRTRGFPILLGAAAYRTTARDLARFVQAQLGFLRSPLSEAMALTRNGLMAENYLPDSLGLGWIKTSSRGASAFWFTGGNEGYQSFVGFDPSRGRGVVILSNSIQIVLDLGLRLLDVVPPRLGG